MKKQIIILGIAALIAGSCGGQAAKQEKKMSNGKNS